MYCSLIEGKLRQESWWRYLPRYFHIIHYKCWQKPFIPCCFSKKCLAFFHYFFILAEGNRVPLQYVDGVVDSDYINAVFVDVRIGHWFFQLFCEDFPLHAACAVNRFSIGFAKPIQHNSNSLTNIFILNNFNSFKMFSQNAHWRHTCDPFLIQEETGVAGEIKPTLLCIIVQERSTLSITFTKVLF